MRSIEILGKILLANELGGDRELAYKFSDPDGVRSGKSGYSFGLCQFDLANNPAAAGCLAACGFTGSEIASLVGQHCYGRELARLNVKLAARASVLDEWDRQELARIHNHVEAVLATSNIRLASPGVFYHLADYHNQFRLEYGGKCVRWLQRLGGGAVTSKDVLDYKRTTLWGRKRPDDVERRFSNIERILGGLQ